MHSISSYEKKNPKNQPLHYWAILLQKDILSWSWYFPISSIIAREVSDPYILVGLTKSLLGTCLGIYWTI